MNNADVARIVGQLEAKVSAIQSTQASIEAKVDLLVKADTLARGGKKMLYKVGAVCSAFGGAAAWAIEHGAKLFA